MTAEVEPALFRATAAARSGDLAAAARLLSGLGHESTAVLDLRARVHAQLGELDEADRCWARIQETCPDDVAAATGRRMIGRIRVGARRPRPLFTTVRVAAVVFLASAAAVGGVMWSNPDTTPVTPDTAARASQDAQRVQELQESLNLTERERAAADARLAEALRKIAADVVVRGVTVRPREKDVQVVFDAGMFGGDSAVVAAESQALLQELGRRLATIPASLTVVGHAVALPGEQSSGGAPIALARAGAAAVELAEGGDLPLTRFTLVAADQQAGPHPDASRNRTVTVLLAPR